MAASTACGITPDRVAFACCLLGSIAPDIGGNGIICHTLPGLRLVSSLIQSLFGHRGFFHGLAHPRGCHYLSHLFADSCTKDGIPALAPFVRRSRGLRIITTGSNTEKVLMFALLIPTLLVGFRLLDGETQRILLGLMGLTKLR